MMRHVKTTRTKDGFGASEVIDETFEEEDGTLYVYRNGDYTTPISITPPKGRFFATDKTNIGLSTWSNKVPAPPLSFEAFEESIESFKQAAESMPSVFGKFNQAAEKLKQQMGDDYDVVPKKPILARDSAPPRRHTPIGTRKIVP